MRETNDISRQGELPENAPLTDETVRAVLAVYLPDKQTAIAENVGFFAVETTKNGTLPLYIGESYLLLARMTYNQALNLFFAGHFGEVCDKDRARVRDAVSAMERDGDFCDVHYDLVRGDGTVVSVRLVAVLTEQNNRRVICAACNSV